MDTIRKKRGFTLIELLVVIAIIGLLASIVLASLSTARSKALHARRQSDMHTIQIALEEYANDNSGSYPPKVGNGNWSALNVLVTGGYVRSLPNDPLAAGAPPDWAWSNQNTYYYWSNTGAGNGTSGGSCSGFHYELWYRLGTNSNGNACAGVHLDNNSFVIQQ